MCNFLNQIENIKRKKLMQVFIDLGMFPDLNAHTMRNFLNQIENIKKKKN